ncbi:MAG TPA: hypothetical protein DEP91_12970 [Sphingomonas bacterium]|jgi:hypothetical protein|uniref:Uncharacterized protein n=1 Tax=Sphingomonas bacterium TaxID=1895847 RepID=A0A3D0WEU1_9SPHN|nr:hypothetical protein [Sphingomonas bacterium]
MTHLILLGVGAAIVLMTPVILKQNGQRKRRQERLARRERNRELDREWQALVKRSRKRPDERG